jgi:YhcH/YjgK/YiaL family protein
MAIFGNLEVVKSQVQDEKFTTAFEYLTKVFNTSSEEYKRLISYELDVFEKIVLDNNNFALEQTYQSKSREKCFFESHQQYIDVQFILDGEEIIEVENSSLLKVSMQYNSEMDLIKYDDTENASSIVLKKGDVAIFYPQDAHMPCLQLSAPVNVIKTVVKVTV